MNTFEKTLADHLTLNQPISAVQKLKNICTLFVINVAWALVVIKFLSWLWPERFSSSINNEMVWQFFFGPQPTFRYEFFMSCIAAPLWEELAFRVFPFGVARWFSDKFGGKEITVYVLIATTILFGWGHGGGTISLLFQGVGGLLLAYAYLRNGYSYWSAVGLHFMWNFFCLIIGF